MPATTNNASNDDYLRTQPPAWTALPSGLSIFAAIVILHIYLRRLRQRRSQAVSWEDTNEKRQFAPHEQSQSQQGPSHSQPRTMNEKQRSNNGSPGGDGHHGRQVSFSSEESPTAFSVDSWRKAGDGGLRTLMSRPPPAPPLTPPELSSTVYTLEARPHGGDSLIHQPNPDYASPSNTSSGSQQSTGPAASHPKRVSYNRTIPIGIPVSRQSSASEPDLFCSPSSYPPTSPILPPAPPTATSRRSADEATFGPGPKGIELHGEIVGVVDENGAGWSRHTRVYGGGVCLACAAAEREHGEGGFYGPNVSPEEMR